MTSPVGRIAMWSGPRNLSTALMRSFENRPDTCVTDEPLYGVYLHTTGKQHPGAAEIMEKMELNWRNVVTRLCGAPPGGHSIWYQKHMAHHLLPTMGRDWLDDVDNVLLIRDPARVVASYVQQHGSVCAEDLGYAQLLEIGEHVMASTGAPPFVVEAEQLQADPETTLRCLCAHLEIAFDVAMLSWPAGPRDSDGVWAPHWYAGVEASTGFKRATSAAPVRLEGHLQQVVDAVTPIYDRLRGWNLQR